MYRDLNDYEILYLIKEQDDDDYGIMYEKYKPLIYKVANKYQKLCKSFGYEFEDLMQVGYLALYKALASYRFDSSMFYTYVCHVIENSIIDVVRRNTTYRKQVLNNSISYDTVDSRTNTSYIDFVADPKSEVTTLDLLAEEEELINFKNTLPFEVACVFELKFNGFKNYEIASLLELDLEVVNRDIQKIKRQFLYR